MRVLDLIKSKFSDGEAFSFERKRAIKLQFKTLRKLLSKGAITDYGKRYGFSTILAQEDFYASYKKEVPISSYSSLYPWWQRSYNGEHDVCWPGKVNYFAKSSGTSEGSSKYIPITEEMLKVIKRVSIKQIISIAKTDMPKDYLTKHYLMIGGSTDLEFNGLNYSGDLSGITTQNLPIWFERFSRPRQSLRKEKDWANKLEKITESAHEYDVTMIAGVPSWIQILFDKIIARYDLKDIHEIWPNLSVFIHGGISIGPYKKSLEEKMGKPIMFFETYLASEGFIALQTDVNSKGMELIFNHGIFYEFIPFNKNNFNEHGELLEDPEVLNLSLVKEEEEYALLITTCAGAWRYMIGDVVKFTDLSKNKIEITGRTKHFLSLCGEHLSVDNMTKAVELTANHFGCSMNEFTVKGLQIDGKFAHEWFIACDKLELNEDLVKEILDVNLKALNEDYATDRKHTLEMVKVHLLPVDVFVKFLNRMGKASAQTKFPRVLSDAQFEEWNEFISVDSNVV